MAIKVITPPTAEPLTLEEVKANLRIGASFIMCPTAGTFTVTAVEQTMG